MQESDQSRQQLLQEVEKVRGYFSGKKDEYDKLSWKSLRVLYLKKGPHKVTLVFGIISAVITTLLLLLIFTLGNGLEELSVITVPCFLMIVFFAIFFINLATYPKMAKEKTQQCTALIQQLLPYYKRYQNCPICFEYTQPECLSMLCDVITTGRADTWKEAISIVSIATQTKRKNLLTIATASTNPNATPEDLIEAYANVYSLFSNPKK